MERFKVGWGADDDWRNALGQCLEQVEPAAADANLGFVYLSDHLSGDASSILTVLRGRTGIDDWVGTTGIGIVANGQQFFDTPALAIMTASVPAAARQLLTPAKPLDAGFRPWFGVTHADPTLEGLPEQLAALESEPGGYWVGGLAASRGPHPVIARSLVSGGAAGVAFSDDVPIITALTQGCSPIGPSREITKAERNIIVELDGEPAFEVFRAEIGEMLARNLNRIPGFIFAGLSHAGSDGGDYLVRDIAGVDPQHGLVAVPQDVTVGERVMFCRRDAGAATTDMTRMLDALGERSADVIPRGGLYFSCLGRGPSLFGEDRSEAAMIRERFPDLPLVGFFGNGEIANSRLYAYTGVLSLFL
ncbi:MAG: FIST N-terminal domain-containing protein [Minwuia sp.]|nr:FIST N-terminal domain-containing protein [Minwuia sp.]